jgi:sugar O-acyltransferase (sialic acid O-acetyltransferase NeuD family)
MKNTTKDSFCNNDTINSRHLRPLIIIGAGGHATSVANVALSIGYTIKHFVDKNKNGMRLFGFDIIGDLNELDNSGDYSFAIAIGDNSVRERVYKEVKGKNMSSISCFPTLIHSSATISSFTNIGEGTVIMPNAVVGPNSNVGKFCIINTRASIDHDCHMHDFSSLAPAATTGGTVQIGLRSAVSIGAIIEQGLIIGNDSVVGANSYLNKNLPKNQIAYGTPAKQIRTRHKGDIYLKIS